MKKILPILIFSFFLQSCFSYKSISYNDIKNEKKQRFAVSKLDKTEIKGRLISIDENKMILEFNGENQTILKDEISDLKVRNFSIFKAAGFGVVSYGALAIIALASFSL